MAKLMKIISNLYKLIVLVQNIKFNQFGQDLIIIMQKALMGKFFHGDLELILYLVIEKKKMKMNIYLLLSLKISLKGKFQENSD